MVQVDFRRLETIGITKGGNLTLRKIMQGRKGHLTIVARGIPSGNLLPFQRQEHGDVVFGGCTRSKRLVLNTVPIEQFIQWDSMLVQPLIQKCLPFGKRFHHPAKRLTFVVLLPTTSPIDVGGVATFPVDGITVTGWIERGHLEARDLVGTRVRTRALPDAVARTLLCIAVFEAKVEWTEVLIIRDAVGITFGHLTLCKRGVELNILGHPLEIKLGFLICMGEMSTLHHDTIVDNAGILNVLVGAGVRGIRSKREAIRA